MAKNITTWKIADFTVSYYRETIQWVKGEYEIGLRINILDWYETGTCNAKSFVFLLDKFLSFLQRKKTSFVYI